MQTCKLANNTDEMYSRCSRTLGGSNENDAVEVSRRTIRVEKQKMRECAGQVLLHMSKHAQRCREVISFCSGGGTSRFRSGRGVVVASSSSSSRSSRRRSSSSSSSSSSSGTCNSLVVGSST